MKRLKTIYNIIAGVLILLAVVLVLTRVVKGFEYRSGDPFKQPVKMRCTCYIDRGTTASGQQTREGIIAGRRDWIGKVAALYAIDDNGNIGEFIGYYEFLDTGAGIDTDGDGHGDSIKNGQSVDVWQPSLNDARKWVKKYGDYVYIKIIDGKG
jgi:hypothetical protein